jgi:hypothetical protein
MKKLGGRPSRNIESTVEKTEWFEGYRRVDGHCNDVFVGWNGNIHSHHSCPLPLLELEEIWVKIAAKHSFAFQTLESVENRVLARISSESKKGKPRSIGCDDRIIA